jgi:hypothetical protein
MPSFAAQFTPDFVCLDERDGIGPHHLAIGKTRKLFESDGVIHAFYSVGYGIVHDRLDAESLALLSHAELDLPVAWGGGAFCVDLIGDRAALLFIHRNRHETFLVRGAAKDGIIAWTRAEPAMRTSGGQAAPWVELGADGTAWCATLSRDGNFRFAVAAPGGAVADAPLFAADETPWYHSCVQVEPIGADTALAIGFRGQFPTRTELVFKTVGRDLKTGASFTLAPCNVNDQLTFHFQAVGDPARGRAHIAYLDTGLNTSHAVYENGAWTVIQDVMPFPSYAPQITLDPDGKLAMVAVDYDGAIWTASSPDGHAWTKPVQLAGLPASTVSGLFGRTGYGTGGLIAAARSSGRVPFLWGVITDDHRARAKLYAASLGRRSGMLFAEPALTLTRDGAHFKGELRLTSLRKADLGKCWRVLVPRQGAEPVAFDVPTDQAQFADAFAQGAAALRFALPAQDGMAPDKAWAESYDDDRLADLAPFEMEAAARTTLAPLRIPAIYKRII